MPGGREEERREGVGQPQTSRNLDDGSSSGMSAHLLWGNSRAWVDWGVMVNDMAKIKCWRRRSCNPLKEQKSAKFQHWMKKWYWPPSKWPPQGLQANHIPLSSPQQTRRYQNSNQGTSDQIPPLRTQVGLSVWFAGKLSGLDSLLHFFLAFFAYCQFCGCCKTPSGQNHFDLIRSK